MIAKIWTCQQSIALSQIIKKNLSATCNNMTHYEYNEQATTRSIKLYNIGIATILILPAILCIVTILMKGGLK